MALDTQADEQQLVEQDQTPEDQTTSDSNSDDTFLAVDERTQYKTREDAIKGYQEAGKRIAELSEWDKSIGKVYGADPSQVAAALEDYIQLKAAQAAAQGKPAVEQATHTDDVQLTPKEQEALKWLQKVSPKLGYVPKSELDEVKAQLAQLQEGIGQQDSARLESQVATGQGALKGLITENKLPDTPEFAQFVEDAVAGWVNQSQQRQATWHRGGTSAQELLKEGFKYVMSGLAPLRNTTTTTYQGKNSGTKTGTVTRLPQVGSKLGTARTQQQKAKPTAADIHNAAWEAANKTWGNTSGE